MRVFLLASTLPTKRAAAVEAVVHETVDRLLAAGVEVTLQPVAAPNVDLPDAVDDELDRLAERGLKTLPPLRAAAVSWPAGRIRANLRRARIVARPRPTDFYPTWPLRGEVLARLSAEQSSVALVLWSPEGLAAAAGNGRIPVVAYYGVPDHLALVARLAAPEVFGIPARSAADRLRLAERRLVARRYGGVHFDLMRGCRIVADLCQAHVRLYARAGHPDARYVPNVYPDRASEARDIPREPRKLIGSIGNARATGNSFGLHYLGREVVPALRRRLGRDAFEVHVCGTGEAPAPVEAALDHPEVIRRGWVDDLDSEILSAQAFLVLNNAGLYQGAYTRVLHAWSLRACVVAHTRLHDAMPEVRHGENALLGSSGADIADLVARVLADDELRGRLGQAGRETYERRFHPRVVVSQLEAIVRAAAAP